MSDFELMVITSAVVLAIFILTRAWGWALLSMIGGMYFLFSSIAHIVDFQIWTAILHFIASVFVGSFCMAIAQAISQKQQ